MSVSLGDLGTKSPPPSGNGQPDDVEQNEKARVNGSTSPFSTSKQAPILRLDNLFNFQLVVFEVENTLFQVLKNGFNVPGTIFEAMFALPQPTLESDDLNFDDLPLVEGNSLENPIQLEDVSAKDFRAFLKVLYPFIGPSVSLTYEDWVGILKLSTMWDFGEIRETAISNLTTLLKEKSAPERISLGRAYRVSKWLRDEYIVLAQKKSLTLDELRDPSGISLDWETIARIQSVREQNILGNVQRGRLTSRSQEYCHTCSTYYGWSTEIIDCRCQLPSVVDSIFRDEFQAMQEPNKADSLPSLPNAAVDSKKKKKKK